VEGRLDEFVPSGNRAVVAFECTWPDDAQAQMFYQVVTMRRGKVVHIQDHDERHSALASVGLD
jgi:hypothetical protein